MAFARASMLLNDGMLIQKDVNIGWNYWQGPLGLHLLAEDDGTFSCRPTAGVAGTGAGGLVGVRWLKLEILGTLTVACWPPRPLVKTQDNIITIWNDGKVHAIGPRGAIRFRFLPGATSPDQVEGRIKARIRVRREVRLTTIFGVRKEDLTASQQASVLSRLKAAIATGAADPGVQLDHAAIGMHHGLGRLQPNEGSGILLDFTPGTGNACIDIIRSDRASDRYNADYLDKITGEPLINPLAVDPSYSNVAGTNKSVVLPEFWKPYDATKPDDRRPRVYADATGCTYLPVLCGYDTSGDTLRGVDGQHDRREKGEQEAAVEQWGDKLAALDRRCGIGNVALQYTDEFITALEQQVNQHPGQGHGFIGRREVGWAKDALNSWAPTRSRALRLSQITQTALMQNAQIMRADIPAAEQFNPQPFPPQGTIPKTEDTAQIMEVIINAWSEARIGNVRLANAIVRRLFVDERQPDGSVVKKSHFSMFGGIHKHVAVAPAGHFGKDAYKDPKYASGGQDYFAWVAVALGLYLDPSYTNQYHDKVQRLGRPSNQPPSTSYADAVNRLKTDIGQEQTGLFLTYAAGHP